MSLRQNFIKLINFNKISQSINKFYCTSNQSATEGCLKLSLHPEIEKAINDQIRAEQQSAQEYLDLATNFKNINIYRPGCYGFFMKSYREELSHMEDFIDYQILRGGKVIIEDIKSPIPKQCLSTLEAYRIALKLELLITQKLETLVRVAENHKDYQCADFVTTNFLNEQATGNIILKNIITQLLGIHDSEVGLFLFDLEISKKYPYEREKRSHG